MKLYMKQKVFSFTTQFSLLDERGYDVYHVEGEFLSLGARLHVLDTQGNEVAFLRQKLFNLLRRYIVEIGGVERAAIQKQFTFFQSKFDIEGPGWQLDGDFLAHEFSLMQGNTCIMRVSKQWLTFGDCYELDIADNADTLLCVCIALAIDMALHEDHNHH